MLVGRPRPRHLPPAALILLSVVCLYGQSTNPLELLKQPVPPASQRIVYGQDAVQFGELRLPAGGGPFPVAILVHGGCWSVKLPDLPEAVTSFELLRPIAAALAESGIATWNIEYRRFGNPGGGWPGTYQDLGRATDMLRDVASRYRLDLSRAIAIGHSSGGQLALWLAARKKLPKDSALHTDSPLPLKGVIDIDGPPDLELFRSMEQSQCGSPVVTNFIGGTPEGLPNRYREGAAAGLLPLGVRQELFLRANSSDPWKKLVDPYVAAAQKAGDSVRLLTQKGPSHFDAINPNSSSWEPVMESARSLLGKSR